MTRADAVRNRERVLDAAREVFAERGLEAGVDAVALRAGVGKATVYRSFPTKEHLVSAVTCGQVDEWVARMLGRDGTGLEVLRATLGEAAEAKAAKVLGGLAGTPIEVPELAAARERWLSALTELLERGRADGTLRGDATADDVAVLFGGACHVLTARGESDPAAWRRQAELVTDAFRAG